MAGHYIIASWSVCQTNSLFISLCLFSFVIHRTIWLTGVVFSMEFHRAFFSHFASDLIFGLWFSIPGFYSFEHLATFGLGLGLSLRNAFLGR